MQTDEWVVRSCRELFEHRGGNQYHGEAVTQLEHALQAAWAAEKDHAEASLIAAALLHDVGHLLHEHGEDCAQRGIDDRHEHSGANWLKRHFGPAVWRPVEMHVAAKRYLSAVRAGYYDRLSDASKLSLQLQGGPMSQAEQAEFVRQPYAEAALRLRVWDDEAKVPNLATPSLSHFMTFVNAALHVRTPDCLPPPASG